jgi:DNA polymerase-3 subunit epsilon
MPDVPIHEPLVFVDLETTGANFANDRIIEVGLIQVDQEGVREWSTLVDPGRPVSPFITGLTGIDTKMVEGAPTFEQLAPELLEKLRGRLFIAHNARFDYGFLKHEFRRIGIAFRATSLCTVKLSRKLFPGHHRHSLDTLVERYGIATGDRHRALADARVLWDLWQHWHALLPAETIRNAVELITGRPELPSQLDPALLDDLPEAPGAYALFGKEGELLLAKRATNIRQQVFAHFAPAKRDTALVRDTWRIEWREAAGELGARLREFELTTALRRPHDDLCSWQLVSHGDGDFRPTLVFARDVDFARTENLFGLYQSRREAVHALRKLAEAHRLCHHQVGLGNNKPGEPCIAYKQKTCRGACIGKEPLSLHSTRLMTALAKHRIHPWPYPGPITLTERDEFGMREDVHVIDAWGYLGTAHDEATLQGIIEHCRTNSGSRFDPDIYRIVGKYIKEGRLKVVPLTL